MKRKFLYIFISILIVCCMGIIVSCSTGKNSPEGDDTNIVGEENTIDDINIEELLEDFKWEKEGNYIVITGLKTFDKMKYIILEGVASIGGYAFRGCSSLANIEIPNSVTSIGNSAFDNCSSLTSISIPNSVTSIGNFAFYRCNRLTKVYYKGTLNEWDSISIDSYGNTSLENATRYYYSENEPTTSGKYYHYDNDGNIVEW